MELVKPARQPSTVAPAASEGQRAAGQPGDTATRFPPCLRVVAAADQQLAVRREVHGVDTACRGGGSGRWDAVEPAGWTGWVCRRLPAQPKPSPSCPSNVRSSLSRRTSVLLLRMGGSGRAGSPGNQEAAAVEGAVLAGAGRERRPQHRGLSSPSVSVRLGCAPDAAYSLPTQPQPPQRLTSPELHRAAPCPAARLAGAAGAWWANPGT